MFYYQLNYFDNNNNSNSDDSRNIKIYTSICTKLIKNHDIVIFCDKKSKQTFLSHRILWIASLRYIVLASPILLSPFFGSEFLCLFDNLITAFNSCTRFFCDECDPMIIPFFTLDNIRHKNHANISPAIFYRQCYTENRCPQSFAILAFSPLGIHFYFIVNKCLLFFLLFSFNCPKFFHAFFFKNEILFICSFADTDTVIWARSSPWTFLFLREIIVSIRWTKMSSVLHRLHGICYFWSQIIIGI